MDHTEDKQDKTYSLTEVIAFYYYLQRKSSGLWLLLLNYYICRINLLFDENVFLRVQSNNEVNIYSTGSLVYYDKALYRKLTL